jgi:orotate phosphoribosyltransferase
MLRAAGVAGPGWPFHTELIEKLRPTPRLSDCTTFSARLRVAEREIGPALRVVDPAAVRGRRILVVDDVLTTGLTLRESARVLHRAGAAEVAGLAVARQPYSPRSSQCPSPR